MAPGKFIILNNREVEVKRFCHLVFLMVKHRHEAKSQGKKKEGAKTYCF